MGNATPKILDAMRGEIANPEQLLADMQTLLEERNRDHQGAQIKQWALKDAPDFVVWRWIADDGKAAGGYYALVMNQAAMRALVLQERAGLTYA